MTLYFCLTNAELVKNFFDSNNIELLLEIQNYCHDKLTSLDNDMRFQVNYSSKDLVSDIINGIYIHDNPEYNFYYGIIYYLICEMYGEKLEENEFFDENYVNFIFDKFPKHTYNQKYFFPLPKFDFPDFISLEKQNILDLESYIKGIDDYDTKYIHLTRIQLEQLKDVFLRAINIAKEKELEIVLMIED